MRSTITIENEVPFGRAIYAWLYLHDLRLEDLVVHDQIETHYLAWETVRKQANPFFENGTGFEGYLIGCCPDAEAALDAVLTISQNILDAIARLYRSQYGLHARLMQTLVRNKSDLADIHIWSAYFGAQLGRLRAQILLNQDAQAFQRQTYMLSSALPRIAYRPVGADVAQTYTVGSDAHTHPNRMSVTMQLLKPSQQDAWLVAENIGEFGHPLVRKVLDQQLEGVKRHSRAVHERDQLAD